MCASHLTLEEALQQAISHHQAGRLGEAEQLYRAILQAVPDHADANHNLGVIAIQTGNLASALMHFKAALDASPGHEQYRISYIEVLIRAGRSVEARRIFDEGKQRGFQGPTIDALEVRLKNADNTAFDVAGTMLRALDHHNAGRLQEAEVFYRQVLDVEPENPYALNAIGMIRCVVGRHEDAERLVRQAISANGEVAIFHQNLGAILTTLHRSEEAEAVCRKALEFDPANAVTLNNLGSALIQQGRYEEAIIQLYRALELRPDMVEAYENLGVAFQNSGRLSDAETCYRDAIALNPERAESYYNLSTVLRECKLLDEAERAVRQAIKIKSDYVEAYGNLGLILHMRELPDQAEVAYRTAIEIRPDFVEGYYNLGIVLREMGRLSDAESSYRQAIAIKPDYAEAYCNLGTVMMDLARFTEAEAAFRNAIDLKSNYLESLCNMGLALCYRGEMQAGFEKLRQALELDPGFAHAHSTIIFFKDLAYGFNTADHQAERKKWAALHADPLYVPSDFPNAPDPERVLRIGYVSADFRNHSAADGLVSLLGNFDGSRFEVYAYSNSRKADHATELFRNSVTAWRNIANQSDEEAANLIRRDAIDILVDLSGHTAGERLRVFARKPAPIQVSVMGYPTGTGMRAMDALFVDPVVVPPQEKHLYAEEIRYLPCVIGYSAKKDYPEVNALPLLANGFVTFGSFNRLVKISDETFALWGRVLCALPESRMILKTGELDDEAARNRVLHHFQGMEDRITLLGKTSWIEHVKTCNLVDISLDPFPHGGGVTTIESIMMGVPLLTLRYPTFVGRVSASILTTLGLMDWIAETPEDYVRIAIEKSRDLAALSELRAELRSVFSSSILGDPDYYLRAAEKEYRALWRAWCARQGSMK